MSTRSRVVALGGALLIAATSVSGVLASSHREAPLISGDPAADNTDLYAFVSPNDTSKLTIVANYIPLQQPGGGPNFHPFDDTVRYRIHIDNNGDAKDDVTYTIRFTNKAKSGRDGISSFLYNNGPLTTVKDENWLAPQEFKVERTKGDDTSTLGSSLRTVPANVGPRSTPTYASLAANGVHSLRNGGKAYAGPRDDAFFVDLGSIFDLGGLRPFNTLHVIPLATAPGVDGVAGYNTATIALQVPISEVRRSSSKPVIGVWASAERRENKEISSNGKVKWSGDWVQVSRLGNPLINEVDDPAPRQGLLECPAAAQGRPVQEVLRGARTRGPHQRPVPGTLGRGHDRSYGPVADPAQGRAWRECDQQRAGPRRHAAGQHRDPARCQGRLPRWDGR